MAFKFGIFTFDVPNKLIKPDAGTTNVELQDLYNACRLFEEQPVNLYLLPVVKAGGKDELGGGRLVGITLTLINDWRLKFADEAGPTIEVREILGGNFLAINQYGNVPVAASTYVMPIIAQDTSVSAIESGVSGLTADESKALLEVHGQIGRSVFFDSTATPGGLGYQQDPVDNIASMVTLATNAKLTRLTLLSDMTLDRNLNDYEFDGRDLKHTVTFAGFTANNSRFDLLSLTGDANGSVLNAYRCILNDLDDFTGELKDCGLKGTLEVASGVTTTLDDSYSTTPGLDRPTVSFVRSTGSTGLNMRSYSGGLIVADMAQLDDSCTVEVEAGRVQVASSCTNGTVSVRGIGHLEDLSGAGCTVNTDGFVNAGDVTNLRKLMQNRMETNPTTGILTIYDDDDVTPLYTGNIYEDVAASQIYRGRGIERRNRLTLTTQGFGAGFSGGFG